MPRGIPRRLDSSVTSPVADPVEPVRDRWEYNTLRMTSDPVENVRLLNLAGADGWEVIDVGMFAYLMKRRVI